MNFKDAIIDKLSDEIQTAKNILIDYFNLCEDADLIDMLQDCLDTNQKNFVDAGKKLEAAQMEIERLKALLEKSK